MKIKKRVVGIWLILLFQLSGCASDSEITAKDELQKEIRKLKTENSMLKKEVSTYKSDSSAVQTSDSTRFTQKVRTFSKNESVDFGDATKKLAEMRIIEVTTNKAAFPKRMNELENYDTKRMIAVKIEYKNVDMDTPFFPYAQSFQAYSKDGKRLTQVNQQIGQDEVPKGKTGITQIFWKLPIKGTDFNKFEIDFVSENQRVATFDLIATH